jgi:hypothetical protein
MVRQVFALIVAGLAVATPLQTTAASPHIYPESSIAEVENTGSGELGLHRLVSNPDIFVFNFPTLADQGTMFNRVVALIERTEAPHDRVLSDQELAELIRSLGRQPTTFAFGNDFRTSELARFFNLAELGHVPLNENERLLRDFLVANDLMRLRFGFYQMTVPDRVILSVPQEQPAAGPGQIPISRATRLTIFHHELSHAEYYTNDAYADYCIQFWSDVMTEDERKAMRQYLAGKNYDPNNEELMINETQAYLFHTPDRNAFDPRSVALPPASIERLRQRFWDGKPPSRLFRSGAG